MYYTVMYVYPHLFDQYLIKSNIALLVTTHVREHLGMSREHPRVCDKDNGSVIFGGDFFLHLIQLLLRIQYCYITTEAAKITENSNYYY